MIPMLALVAPLQARAAAPNAAAPQFLARLRRDAYHAHAVKPFGQPVSTQLREVRHTDDGTFGTLEFRFGDGAILEDETDPPEVFRIPLTRQAGLPDPEGTRRFAGMAAKASGFQVDHQHPEHREDGGVSTTVHWDPDTGINAAIEFSQRGPKLLAVRVHAAP